MKLNSVLVTAKISEKNKAELSSLIGEEHITYVAPFDFNTMLVLAQKGLKKEEILALRKENSAEIKRIVVEKNIDAAILGGDITPSIMASPSLKWIHCVHAGVEKSATKGLFDRGIILTSSAGRSAPAIAEHAVMFILSLVYDINHIVSVQKEHKFDLGAAYKRRTGLMGKTVSIIGMGHNGRELALRLKPFGVKTIGLDREISEIKGVDEVLVSNSESLDRIARESDFIVLAVSLNDSTYHMIDKEFLSKMKRSAYLINIARGGLVDTPSLIEALNEKTIAGAALDTVEPEPLAADSPLWDMDNVIITPHTSPIIPDKDDREWEYVFQNVKAYLNDGEFVNRMKESDMFTLPNKNQLF